MSLIFIPPPLGVLQALTTSPATPFPSTYPFQAAVPRASNTLYSLSNDEAFHDHHRFIRLDGGYFGIILLDTQTTMDQLYQENV